MSDRPLPPKSLDAYRTISEVAGELKIPQHVLRFWETRFPQVKPLKRAGGRRFYRPEDVALLRAVQALLYGEGYTIKGVQRLLHEFGARNVADALARSAPPAGEVGGARPRGADAEGDGSTDMPKHDTPPRRSLRGEPPRPALEAPAGEAARPAGAPSGARDLVARLEGVLAELTECGRLLSSVRATRD